MTLKATDNAKVVSSVLALGIFKARIRMVGFLTKRRPDMAWLLLTFAGIFEVVWAVGLKYTEGFTKLIPSMITVSAMFLSFWLLSISIRTLPLGVSYAVWTGIGIVGTALFGMLWLGESANILKIIFISFILIGILGLQTSS